MKRKSTLFLVALTISILSMSAQVQIGGEINGEAANDGSGISISMPNAQTVAIGAHANDGNGNRSGHVRVYNWSGITWVQKGVDIDGEAAEDQSGYSISMPDASTVAIGAPFNDGSGNLAGHVRVYAWNGTIWAQKGADIDGTAVNDWSGFSVSMPDNNTVAIGAPNSVRGYVRVFTWSGTSWVQKGGRIDGEAFGDKSGYSVSMPDANTVAIGARSNDGNTLFTGHVRVLIWSGISWVQKGLDIDGEAAYDESGFSVSMPNSNTVAIGAPFNSGNGTYSGHVRIYTWNGTSWVQKGLDIDGETAEDWFGKSVSMPDANTVAIGSGVGGGQVKVYSWNVSTWVQRGVDIDALTANEVFGYSVSMPDFNTVGIGAFGNAGKVRIYSLNDIGVLENYPSSYFRLYPNPASRTLNIEVGIDSFNENYFMCDGAGRVVRTGKINSIVTPVEISTLAAGVYTIHLGSDLHEKFILRN